MNNEMNTSMQSRRLAPGGTHGTPESEFSNFECFQNYTASEVFVQGLAGIVNQTDVEIIIRAQKLMLQRFEKTNEMLLNCNALSAGRIKTASEDFKQYTKLINEMKKDLDHIFKKIRTIKTKMNAQYPNSMTDMQSRVAENNLSDGSENEEIGIIAEEQTYANLHNKHKENSNEATKPKAIDSTVSYVPLRHESEASSSPASNDVLQIDLSNCKGSAPNQK